MLGARVTAAGVLAAALALAGAAQAGPTAAANSFTLSGSVTGSLSDVSAACSASRSAADVQFAWYGNVTSLSGGGVSSKSIVDIEVDLGAKGYGRSGKLSHRSLTHAPFVTYGATDGQNPEVLAPIWRAFKGHYSTTAGGADGTLEVTLKETQTLHPHGRLVLSGGWSGCPVAAGT